MNGEDYFRNSSEESESEIRSVVSDSLWPCGLYSPWNSPGRNTGVGCLSLLQGIFPIQGWNSGLLHCRRILHQLSHKGSPAWRKRLLSLFYPCFRAGKLGLCDVSWFFLCTSACRLGRKLSTSKFSTLPNITVFRRKVVHTIFEHRQQKINLIIQGC